MFRLPLVVCALLVASSLWWSACDPKTGTPDGGITEQTNPPDDRSTPPEGSTPTEKPVTSGNWPPPEGMVALAFSVDDTANKTYKNNQLFWNGSFKYDEKTNTVVYASAWQPTDGPFPPLYDDGPIDQGGHEPPGSTANDNIFGIVVFVKPDPKQDLEFEFGLINNDNHWLWEGANGLLIVKPDTKPGELLKAKTFSIAKHGSIDIKLTLDLNKLPEAFQVDDVTSPPPIFVKGSMSNWSHIQVLDKAKNGDDKPGDGILTFVQSKVLSYSPHFGLLAFERHVQFVFQFNSISGREYKDIDDKAIMDGVTAWADCNGDGAFTDDEKQKIILEKDSRGAVQNTTIIVCEGKTPPCTKDNCSEERCKQATVCQGGCTKNEDCKADEICERGSCQPKQQSCTKSDCATVQCKDDPVCKCATDGDCNAGETCNTGTGQCEAQVKCKADSDCPPANTCDTATGRCLAKACTDQDCNDPRCQSDPVCNDPNKGPVIYFVVPGVGPEAGGTEVTITGERFQQGAKIQFAGKDCTDLKIASDQRATCKSPAGTKGAVDVVLINPDGKRNTFPQGFRYDDSAANQPQIASVSPDKGDVAGGIKVTITGTNFASGAKVKFGQTEAQNVSRVSATEITCDAPAHPSGKVAVTVTNPDGLSDTLLDAFEFFEKNPTADWARQVWPPTLTGPVGTPLGPIFCQVYDASFNTKAQGAAPNIQVEVGWGTQGADPKTWPAAQWSKATFNKDVGNNDEYQGNITVSTAGTYNYACRVSLDGGTNWSYADHDQGGSNSGYKSSDAGVVTATSASTLSVSAVEPAYGLAIGGSVVTVRGGGFAAGITVSFGGKAGTNLKVVSQTEIQVTTPAGTAGSVTVSVSLSGSNADKKDAFTFTTTGATVDWCKIQWPNSIPDSGNGVAGVKAGQASPEIYGWVYKKGVTDAAGKGAGIIGQVGIGPTGTDPGKDARWIWFPASYLGDKAGIGNPTANDEYKGTVTPPAAGSYDYAYRFSSDGYTFHHCDRTGNNGPDAFRSAQAGKLTAN